MNLSVSQSLPFRRSLAPAFTLVEMLTVMAIFGVMMAATLPALNGLRGAGDITRAAYDISETLEQARSYAMANHTYVYVGFSERDSQDAAKAGVGQILLITMGAKDGMRGVGSDSSNLLPLTRLRRIENVHMEDQLPQTGALGRPVVPDILRVGSDSFGNADSFTAAGVEFTKIIQFDPQGSARVQSNPATIPQWLEIGLVGTRGSTVVNRQNCAALILSGVTGSTKIYRP